MDQFSFSDYPNTNFNEINLDWIAQIIQQLTELVESGRYGVPTGGETGQVLGKLSDSDFDTGWIDQTGGGGGGGTDDYNALRNRPSINNVLLVGNKTLAQLGITAAALGAYVKPSGGIPKSDLASAVQTSLGKADTALQSVPSTYRTAAAQDTIDSGKIDKPSNPSSGAFLVWDGTAWVAQTLATWQGGNY